MFFVSRPNLFFDFLYKQTRLSLFLAIIFILISILFCWHVFLYMPISNDIKSISVFLNSAKKNDSVYFDGDKICKAKNKEVNFLNKKIASIKTKANLFPSQMAFVVDLSDRFDIDISVCLPLKKIFEKDYKIIPLNLSCSGSLKNILFFLKAIESSKKYIACDDFSLNMQNHEKTFLNCTFLCSSFK